MIFRGFLTFLTSSSSEWHPIKFFPFAFSSINASTFSVVRLNTATLYPRLSIFRAKFSPITARPIKPKSAEVVAIEGSGFGKDEFLSREQTCSRRSRRRNLQTPKSTFPRHLGHTFVTQRRRGAKTQRSTLNHST